MIDRLRSANTIGILFAGGSARCAFQVGVMETLTDLGIRPAMVLGVSGGAWNAAAVAVGNAGKLRAYWRFFNRMPCVDLGNLAREHSPWMWSRIHDRAFRRYIGNERIKAPGTLPLLIALTRLRDRTQMIVDARETDDPFRVLLASNYLPPFYTHAPTIDGHPCGDGGFADNLPYETLFARGCDAVILIAQKGESEGGLYRNHEDFDHVIPPAYAERMVVIRPRYRLPIGFVERRWEKLAPIMSLGALRAREVLLGERHPETDLAATGLALSQYFVRGFRWAKGLRAGRSTPATIR